MNTPDSVATALHRQPYHRPAMLLPSLVIALGTALPIAAAAQPGTHTADRTCVTTAADAQRCAPGVARTSAPTVPLARRAAPAAAASQHTAPSRGGQPAMRKPSSREDFERDLWRHQGVG